jgi:protoheme IX farnesyltransferase
MSHSPSHAESQPATNVKAHTRVGDYLTLAKPRLNFLVLLTTAAAYSLGAPPDATLAAFAHTLIGTFLVAAGSAALNQVWERATDRLMRRTQLRPLADQRMSVAEGTTFGLILTVVGVAELAYFVNSLSAAVALVTTASYILFYTPLKLRTSLSTIAGAIPGALPAVIGWAAATNTVSLEAWVLFGIVFMWQMPHFLAIAWMYRDEYARAGVPLLPVI